MHQLRELKVWTKSMDLCVEVYKACGELPKDEIYGLASQIKRAAISIPSNISEGAGRNSYKEFLHFLSIANGSANELMTQLILTNRLGLITNTTVDPLLQSLTEIQKMNSAFQKSIRMKLKV
jgi:four helix bundle protein